MKLIHTCIALSLAGVISSATITAQQPAPPAGEQARAQTPEPVTGAILSVDDKAKTIVVKTTPDSEMKFSYSRGDGDCRRREGAGGSRDQHRNDRDGDLRRPRHHECGRQD